MIVLDTNIIKEIITLHDTFFNTFLYVQKAEEKKNINHSVKSFSRRSRFFFSSSI